MTLLQLGAGALGRSRSTGFRVLLSVATMLLLDGCRTWDDTGDGYGRRHYHHHYRQPSRHPPPPAPLVVPKFQPPAQPPIQPTYRPPPPSGHHWHHQRSGEPSRQSGRDHGGSRHERKWRSDNGGHDHRKRR
jgi:hypothetical protein